jgi:alpha-glucoside transport system substrate-binding protein
MTFLASPEAGEIMASRGGYLSANRNLDPASYPDDTTRALAAGVVEAVLLRFDLSDLTPQAFGGGSSAHMWVVLQNFLGGQLTATQAAAQLEDAASIDFEPLAQLAEPSTVHMGGHR